MIVISIIVALVRFILFKTVSLIKKPSRMAAKERPVLWELQDHISEPFLISFYYYSPYILFFYKTVVSFR
jgi:hypothetical protein